MQIKHVKKDDLEFKYKCFKYPYKKKHLIKTEIQRYRFYNKLNTYFKVFFNNSQININWMLIKNVLLNYSNMDPVFSIIDKNNLVKAYNLNNDINLDKNIKEINHKIMKYILKLYEYTLNINDSDYKIITKNINDSCILYVENYEDETKVIINKEIFNKMRDRYYHKNKDNLDINLIWLIIFRYQYLDILYFSQAKLNDSFYYEIKEKLNIDVELFGSAFNSTLKYYGSLFYDIEKYFGSIGNFFNCELIKGNYLMSPPYGFKLINSAFDKLYYFLTKKDSQITVLTILPVWYNKDEHEYLNKVCEKKETLYNSAILNIQDTKNSVNVLKNTKYNIFDKLYCKGLIEYYNVDKNKIKEIYENHHNIMIFSNVLKNVKFDIIPDFIEFKK
ncbi:phosphorylated CTD interacting factor 1 WW domain protein [Hokovirus HKV1]|uniref:Phosphorylated CTD interacting factor 1 WW domain protein n=1 Tax=Hokovirus HKV1 TaxID=1977638 RepID=A0A1V0SFI2_9VIRU|nr:phosphorylated CTD interacting factor 1 WW domain protein [Hokovirus HKV1]